MHNADIYIFGSNLSSTWHIAPMLDCCFTNKLKKAVLRYCRCVQKHIQFGSVLMFHRVLVHRAYIPPCLCSIMFRLQSTMSLVHHVYVPLTLRASLSGTFLQTLPKLVMLLKGHSLSPRSCPPTWSAPSERFGC